MSREAIKRNQAKQPDKKVRCGFCGRGINLRRDYGHYDKKWDGRYMCEECYYHPGHQY